MPSLEINLMLISALYTNSWRLVFKENRVVVLRAEQSITVSSHREVYSVVVAVSVA
jgi:hypothetical protein